MDIVVIALLVLAMVLTVVRILRKKQEKSTGLVAVIVLGLATMMIILRRFGA